MRLVPRQLRRSTVQGRVPYYGGRLTPGVIQGMSAPADAAPSGDPAPTVVTSTTPIVAVTDVPRLLAALGELGDAGVLTPDEATIVRRRITGQR